MEIKYEPVFGDQALFDGAPEDAVAVFKSQKHDSRPAYYRLLNGHERYLSGEWIQVPQIPQINSQTFNAMRRIIQEPKRWTMEDKKAGRLPEVGCVVMVSPNCTATVTAVDNIQKVVSVQCENQALDILAIHEMLPIESPEEKAARLRDEWCRKCTSQFYPMGSNGFPEMIHDALLSGELPVPKKGGE